MLRATSAITAEYAKGATLHWVSGPLDGTYDGPKLREVWTKFGAANGTLQAAVGTATESSNPKGATMSIPVVFTGKNTVEALSWADQRFAYTVSEANERDRLTLVGDLVRRQMPSSERRS